jgi:hypothetical protein
MKAARFCQPKTAAARRATEARIRESLIMF